MNNNIRHAYLCSIYYAGATTFNNNEFRWSLMKLGEEISFGKASSFDDGNKKIMESYYNHITPQEATSDNTMRFNLSL